MKFPRLDATIERRLLVNYRLDAQVAASLIPGDLAPGLRPQLVDGSAVAGICLIRLAHLRPSGIGARIGWRGENAAHRIAVEWDDATGTRTGVFIPLRHSASWLPVASGERVFPGVHRHASFDVRESADRLSIGIRSASTAVHADVAVSPTWRSGLFPTLDDASAFFRAGNVGWSPVRDGSRLEGLRLGTDSWRVAAGEALSVESSYFAALPTGSAHLDCVLVMRDVPITWSSVPAPREVDRSRVVTDRVGPRG